MTPAAVVGHAQRGARGAVPALSFVILLVLVLAPAPIAFFGGVAPALPLMAIYYWVMLRPDLMPRTLVFVAGLLEDALMGVPLGVHALVYLLAHVAILSQRQFIAGKPFWLFWCGFGLLAPVALALRWTIVSALRGELLAPDMVAVNILLTLVLFPAIAGPLFQTQRAIVGGGAE